MAKTAKNVTQKDLNRILGNTMVILSVVLLTAGLLALWGRSFATSQVKSQLTQENIYFPEAGSPALDPQKYPGLQQYAGQAVDTGPKAKAYADEFIWVHMMDASEGRSYAEISDLARQNPDDETLAELRQSLFMGSMLRSSLLTAYAFSVFGLIAGYAAAAALLGSVILLLLASKFYAKTRRS